MGSGEQHATIHGKDKTNGRGVYIFGVDVSQIPCFRDSFLTGICTGIVGGFACFMATSRPILSTNAALASLWLGVIVVWFPCRYKYESRYLAGGAIRNEMNQKSGESNISRI